MLKFHLRISLLLQKNANYSSKKNPNVVNYED